MKYIRYALAAAALAGVFVLGNCSRDWFTFEETVRGERDWYCSMHPEERGYEGDRCRKCDMDLIPQKEDKLGRRRMSMSYEDLKLAEIGTERVTKRVLEHRVRLLGKVDFDETRVKTISARAPGRLDRMFVDFTGIRVKKGDHLVSLYSPDLLVAQEELLTAAGQLAASKKRKGDEFLSASDRRAYKSAREKLLLLGLTIGQLDAIEKRGTASDHLEITSQIGGIVTKKSVNEGDYVETGSAIYEIADVSKVWVRLDAYEQDLTWLRYGQRVEIVAEAHPGTVLEGLISFIDPVMNERTRTIQIRVNVDNAGGLLKPGMFVRSQVSSLVGQRGRIIDSRLAGKWVSPMHPEIVKDGPGKCDVCGMALVRAEELGYVSADQPSAKVLALPATAALLTGKRAIVYVKVQDAVDPTFEGRVVTLGPRAGDYFVVLDGLEVGEEVVTHGAFRIDSSLQLAGKFGMLSGPASAGHRQTMLPVIDAYIRMHTALAQDDVDAARRALADVSTAVAQIDRDEARASEDWTIRAAPVLLAAVKIDSASADIGLLRVALRDLSTGLAPLIRDFGHTAKGTLHRFHCPMAFSGAGGEWIQLGATVRNPYETGMPRCGTERDAYPALEGR